MANSTALDRSKKVTISLPASLLEIIDNLAQERKESRSVIIAEMVRKIADEEFEAEMREGYLANAEFAKQLAEEDMEAGNENWPEWVDTSHKS